MMNTAGGAEGNRLTERQIRVGFPGVPNDIDAAFVWSGNGRIYFIKGSRQRNVGLCVFSGVLR